MKFYRTQIGNLVAAIQAAAMARAVALLRAEPAPEADSPANGPADAPEGIPPALWASLPPDVQAQLAEAVALGAKVEIVSASDMMNELDNATKH